MSRDVACRYMRVIEINRQLRQPGTSRPSTPCAASLPPKLRYTLGTAKIRTTTPMKGLSSGAAGGPTIGRPRGSARAHRARRGRLGRARGAHALDSGGSGPASIRVRPGVGLGEDWKVEVAQPPSNASSVGDAGQQREPPTVANAGESRIGRCSMTMQRAQRARTTATLLVTARSAGALVGRPLRRMGTERLRWPSPVERFR